MAVTRLSRRAAGLAMLAGLSLVAASAASAASATPAAGVAAHVRVEPMAHLVKHSFGITPPTTADCQASSGISCYQPAQVQRAYNEGPLFNAGLAGSGRTIAIVDAFGSPTIRADLRKFDRDFGLPAPPRFDIIQPAGRVPAFDPNDADMGNWAFETTLDIEWAHTMAPGANLLLVETPVAETEGVEGFPEIVRAENFVIDHGLADVISQSFGATEETFPSVQALRGLRGAYINAARHHITVLASTGDSGAANVTNTGDLFTHPTVIWPASDPLVTAVGGTQLHLDADGNRLAPDNVWNDSALFGEPVAGGGGTSLVFRRPGFQDGVRRVVGGGRGIPDVSMSAAVDGGVLVFLGFTSPAAGVTPGYFIVGGTSEASPLMAGLVSIASQVAHRRLGQINDALYDLSRRRHGGIVDVTAGNNIVTFTQDAQSFTFGFTAVGGYDLASGIGTVDAAHFVPALASRAHK